jgi:hypothetical protein
MRVESEATYAGLQGCRGHGYCMLNWLISDDQGHGFARLNPGGSDAIPVACVIPV